MKSSRLRVFAVKPGKLKAYGDSKQRQTNNAEWYKLRHESSTVVQELSSTFVSRMEVILSNRTITEEEKIRLHANLSRGPVHKKWGAFPVAIWLALETGGSPANLAYWLNKGPEAVYILAGKYLNR